MPRANASIWNLGSASALNWSWGFLKPSLKYAYTQYDLDLDGRGQSTLASYESFDSSQNRSVPIFSVDSGLYLDRNQWFGKDYRQTLEPRLFYLYVPEEDQDDIPIFDTGESSFSYSSLWRENRFSGKDRIGDANQVSLGVTSRWVEPNGFERQRFSMARRSTSKTARFNCAASITARAPVPPPTYRRMRWSTCTATTKTGASPRPSTGIGQPQHPLRQCHVALPAGRQPGQDRQSRLSLSQRHHALRPGDR